MKYRLAFVSPVVLAALGLFVAQSSACGGSSQDVAADAGLDAGDAEIVLGDELDEILTPVPDASVSCAVNKTGNTVEDYIAFCFQKQVLETEHGVFDPKLGIASSWSATTGEPASDGGVVLHDVHDDVAYAASLASFAISAEEYGDTSIQQNILSPDSAALASIIAGKLATLPATYEGEIYMRLRRFADGLRVQGGLLTQTDATAGGTEIDALADAYGRAIYTTYFHLIPASTVDAGAMGAGEDAGAADAGSGDASTPSGGNDAGGPDAASEDGGVSLAFQDGILGVPQPGGGILYDVDQAASGALALIDMASRHQTDDPTHAYLWADAALSVFNHLAARARHSSGLYYADLITSSDPGHDALASVSTPNDALLAETQASVAASLMRALGIVEAEDMSGVLAGLTAFPFAATAAAPLSALKGVEPDGGSGASLWDPTPTTATTADCDLLEDAAACGGSGLFWRYLPSTGMVDSSEKTLRANALAYGAVHRSIVEPGSALSIDYEALTALIQTNDANGKDVSFLSQTSGQTAYPNAVSATFGFLSSSSPSFSAQADAYALEALTEQWIGRMDCPPSFF